MRVVLTGCNGLLGRSTAQALISDGHQVVGIDVVPRNESPHPVYVADLRDPFAIHRAIERSGYIPDTIVHLANHRNPESASPETVLRENLSMNTSVAVAALQLRIRRLVFSSSIQAFLGGIQRNIAGEMIYPPRFPIDETILPQPMNTYGLSKLLTEHMLEHLSSPEQFESALTAFSLRFPYLMPQTSLEMVAARSGPTEYRWGGAEAFAYLHVDDAANAIVRASQVDIDGHRILWLAAPDPRTPESAADLADRYYQHVEGVEHVYETQSFMNCDLAKTVLGWIPERTIQSIRYQRGGQDCT